MGGKGSASFGNQLGAGQYYGVVVKKYDCSGLRLTKLRYNLARLPEHNHQLAHFWFLIEGDYVEFSGSDVYSYRPLRLMFQPPEVTHHAEIGPRGAHFFNVEIGPEWMTRLSEYSTVPDKLVQSDELTSLAIRLYREFKSSDVYSALAIEGLVMTILAEIARARVITERRAPGWLARVVDLLYEEFNQPLKINSIAAEVGVHPFHLSKVFRQFQHQTVSDYIKGLRVKFACQELLNSNTELAAIALAAGFADQSHFTRVFKQMTGMTPRAFRMAVRNGRNHNV